MISINECIFKTSLFFFATKPNPEQLQQQLEWCLTPKCLCSCSTGVTRDICKTHTMSKSYEGKRQKSITTLI